MLVIAIAIASQAPGRVTAQPVGAGYDVPCQPRRAFVDRLRGMVADPDHVELDVLQFSVIVTRDSDAPSASWTLVVNNTRQQNAGARVVREASCEAAADAAVVVTAAWINEQRPQQQLTAAQASRSGACPRCPEQIEPSAVYGVAFSLDGALELAPAASGGVSAEVWRLSASRNVQHSLGIRGWASHFALSLRPRDDVYEPSFGELYYMLTYYIAQLGPVAIGAWVSPQIGLRPVTDGPVAISSRLSAGIAVRADIQDTWSVLLRFGLSDEHDRAIPMLSLGLSLPL